MRTSVSRALAVYLVFAAAGCGPPATRPGPEPEPEAIPNTGKLTVHLKEMKKKLDLT